MNPEERAHDPLEAFERGMDRIVARHDPAEAEQQLLLRHIKALTNGLVTRPTARSVSRCELLGHRHFANGRMIPVAVLKLVNFGLAVAERVAAYQDRRRAARRLRDAWANATVPVRGCARCHEIAYLPQQTNCFKCRFALKP